MHLRPLGTDQDGVYATAAMQVIGWRRALQLLLLLTALGSGDGDAMGRRRWISWCLSVPSDDDYCLSWRVAVETGNIRGWRAVPGQCLRHVEGYMLGGQYRRDVGTVVEQIYQHVRGVPFSGDGKDAWVMDVDDTCLSNLRYYQGKRFGGDPFDPVGFKTWAQMGLCPAIPAVLQVFNDLVAAGFKVFLLTGRDEETMGVPTTENLHNQGFLNYERLIMRGPAYRGKSAVVFKSSVRNELVKEGYRIWGNIGDQWSDLLGDCVGDRTFKIPNPMYFVP